MRVAELRRLAISGGLVAAAFAVKYALIGIPNVEPLTLAFFAVGFAYGPIWGAFVGIIGEGMFAAINPMGAPIAPVWVAQIIGMALAGMIGGLAGAAIRGRGEGKRWQIVALVGAGVLATLLFDLLTNVAMAWSIGPFWPVMAAAIPFAGIHVLSNALLFALIFPILQRWLIRYTSAAPPQTLPS